MNDYTTEKTVRRAAVMVIAAILITALYVGQALLIPLALAMFLCLLLNIPVKRVQRIGIGRVPAVVVVFMATTLVVGAIGWVVLGQVSALATELPRYRQNIETKIANFHAKITQTRERASSIKKTLAGESKSATSVAVVAAEGDGATLKTETTLAGGVAGQGDVSIKAESATSQPVQVEVVQPESNLLASVGEWWAPVTHPMATAGVTFVLLLFLLVYLEDLRDRVLRVCGRAHIQITTAAIADSETRIVKFFAAQAISNALVGTAVGLGLFALGVPKAALWGLILAVLRFVPFLGPFVAVGFPVVLSAAISDGWMIPILVILLAVGMDLLAGNALEPWLFGMRVGASAPAIFLSFIFWGALWGPAGLVLATPIMVCLIVLGKHVPAFETFYVLFGNEPVLEPSLRFYQRLLALDAADARAITKKQADETSVSETLESVVWPGLSMVESDRIDGMLDADRAAKARDIAATVISKMIEDQPAATEDIPRRVRPTSVMFLPDRGTFDELLTPWVQADIQRRGNAIIVVPPSALVSEIVQKIESEKPDVLAVCAVEPRNVDRILHIHKRLEMAGTPIPMNILLVSGTYRSPALRRRLMRLDNVRVRGTMADFLSGMEPPAVPPSESGGALPASDSRLADAGGAVLGI